MKFQLVAATLLGFVPQLAWGCTSDHFAFGQDIKQILISSQDPHSTQYAQYLNNSFYHDLACRLDNIASFQPARGITPQMVARSIETLLTQRNQSDALIMILTAMQGTDPKD